MKIAMLSSIFNSILNTIVYENREIIGILGTTGENTINYVYIDEDAISAKYCCRLSPNVLYKMHSKSNARFVGIIHSHPPSYHSLSEADIIYARRILKMSHLQFIIMGVVSDASIFLYAVFTDLIDELSLLIH